MKKALAILALVVVGGEGGAPQGTVVAGGAHGRVLAALADGMEADIISI